MRVINSATTAQEHSDSRFIILLSCLMPHNISRKKHSSCPSMIYLYTYRHSPQTQTMSRSWRIICPTRWRLSVSGSTLWLLLPGQTWIWKYMDVHPYKHRSNPHFTRQNTVLPVNLNENRVCEKTKILKYIWLSFDKMLNWDGCECLFQEVICLIQLLQSNLN